MPTVFVDTAAWLALINISIILMQKDLIDKAFTSDHHFEQAGFVKLL